MFITTEAIRVTHNFTHHSMANQQIVISSKKVSYGLFCKCICTICIIIIQNFGLWQVLALLGKFLGTIFMLIVSQVKW